MLLAVRKDRNRHRFTLHIILDICPKEITPRLIAIFGTERSMFALVWMMAPLSTSHQVFAYQVQEAVMAKRKLFVVTIWWYHVKIVVVDPIRSMRVELLCWIGRVCPCSSFFFVFESLHDCPRFYCFCRCRPSHNYYVIRKLQRASRALSPYAPWVS